MQYLDAIRLIAVACRAELSAQEVFVLLFINDRTLRFNKRRERIPFRHFTEGVFTADGSAVTAKVPFSKSTIRRVLQVIEERGLIKISGKNGEMPTIEFLPDALMAFAESSAVCKLKVPKQPKKASKKPLDPYQPETGTHTTVRRVPVPQGDGSYKEIDIKERRKVRRENFSDEPLVVRKATVESLIENVKDRCRNKSAAKADSIDSRPTMTNIGAAWSSAMQGKHDGVVLASVSRREFGIFRRNFDKHQLPIPLSEFIPWVIDNWAELRTNELSWCDKMPHLPTLGFFAGMFFHFARSHSEAVARKRTEEAKWQRRDSATAKAARQTETANLQLIAKSRELEKAQKQNQHLQRMLQNANRAQPAAVAIKMRHTHELDFESIEPLPE